MDARTTLAIHGGTPAKTVPYGVGRRFLGNEARYLREALESNTLFYAFGNQVRQACEMVAEYASVPHVVAASSGSAAVHLGLIAAGIGPGDEVICTPNTDSGSVLGIIEEGAVPVFCDCEDTLQPSARTVAARITEHTRAVIVVHLAGYPAPADEIVALCEPRGIAVIEDCAQSWGTRLHGRIVGSFGSVGCYSTNDFKHLSTGEGGFVALKDEALYRRVSNYGDKYYDRLFGGEFRQAHHGLNYRMTELQGAVARAQLEKVDQIASRHHAIGETLRTGLEGLPGATMLAPIDGGYSTYWWSALLVDLDRVSVSRDELVSALQAEGIATEAYGRYDLLATRLFQTRLVRPWLSGERAMYPFVQPDGRSYTYSYDDTPNHRRLLGSTISLQIKASYTDQDVEETIAGITKAFSALAR